MFVLFILFMLYLAINCFKSAMTLNRGERPQSILFFEELAIIKEREGSE